MTEIGTRVPSLDVAISRVTTYSERSTEVVVRRAVGVGSPPSPLTHQVPASVYDAPRHATRFDRSCVRRAPNEDTELTGGMSTGASAPPLVSKRRTCWGPPSRSATHTVPLVTVTSSMARSLAGTIVSASETVTPSASGSRSTWPFGAPSRESRKSASSPRTAWTQRSGMSATCHQAEPSAWARTKICHSPPSPFCTRSIAQRPSGEEVRKFSEICGSAKGPDRSSVSVPAPRSRNQTC